MPPFPQSLAVRMGSANKLVWYLKTAQLQKHVRIQDLSQIGQSRAKLTFHSSNTASCPKLSWKEKDEIFDSHQPNRAAVKPSEQIRGPTPLLSLLIPIVWLHSVLFWPPVALMTWRKRNCEDAAHWDWDISGQWETERAFILVLTCFE